MEHSLDSTFTKERCQKLAAIFVIVVGFLRLIGVAYLRYRGITGYSWISIAPFPLLLGLGIGVYFGYRWAWAVSFFICAALIYQLLSQLISVNWSQAKFSWDVIGSLSLTAVDFTVDLLALVFLTLAQYKKNRAQTDGVAPVAS